MHPNDAAIAVGVVRQAQYDLRWIVLKSQGCQQIDGNHWQLSDRKDFVIKFFVS